MKLNQGYISTLILFLVFITAIGALVYLKPGHYGLGKIKILSFLNEDSVIEEIVPEVPVGPLPVVDVGSDIFIKYPKTSVTLKGKATADDGGELSYEWFKLTGGLANISSTFKDTTTVSGLKKGKYLFRLIVTDSKGVKSSDEVYVTMEGGPAPVKVAKKSTPKTITPTTLTLPNIDITQVPVPTIIPSSNPNPISTQTGNPVADGGPDKEITLPTSSVFLSGSATDVGATIVSYAWSQIEGGQANIDSPFSPYTTVSGLDVGSYRFRLTVIDDQGFSDTDTVGVMVNAEITIENIPPTVSAGPDQNIRLPETTVTLSGSASDPDGYIVSYEWTQIQGATATIDSPSQAVTTISNLAVGSYMFGLIATDDFGDADSSTVTITVAEALVEPES